MRIVGTSATQTVAAAPNTNGGGAVVGVVGTPGGVIPGTCGWNGTNGVVTGGGPIPGTVVLVVEVVVVVDVPVGREVEVVVDVVTAVVVVVPGAQASGNVVERVTDSAPSV